MRIDTLLMNDGTINEPLLGPLPLSSKATHPLTTCVRIGQYHLCGEPPTYPGTSSHHGVARTYS